tara:strand:+ start:1102 stop:1707 length:606 start_codon:yes stop_codon:yes gene_type:complete
MDNELVCLNTTDASHRLILLHGWGADAEDLMPIGEKLKLHLQKKVEIISLRAPYSHPQGIGRQWYPLFPADWSLVPFEIEKLKLRIRNVASQNIPLEKTAILGFSQGGAMALASGSELAMAGLICCSSYPHPNWSPPLIMPPIFLTHGSHDEVVPPLAIDKIKEILKNNKSDLDIELFEGGHEIPEPLFNKFQLFLNKWFI